MPLWIAFVAFILGGIAALSSDAKKDGKGNETRFLARNRTVGGGGNHRDKSRSDAAKPNRTRRVAGSETENENDENDENGEDKNHGRPRNHGRHDTTDRVSSSSTRTRSDSIKPAVKKSASEKKPEPEPESKPEPEPKPEPASESQPEK